MRFIADKNYYNTLMTGDVIIVKKKSYNIVTTYILYLYETE